MFNCRVITAKDFNMYRKKFIMNKITKMDIFLKPGESTASSDSTTLKEPVNDRNAMIRMNKKLCQEYIDVCKKFNVEEHYAKIYCELVVEDIAFEELGPEDIGDFAMGYYPMLGYKGEETNSDEESLELFLRDKMDEYKRGRANDKS